MTKYILMQDGSVVDSETGESNITPQHRKWLKYQEWLLSGNQPENGTTKKEALIERLEHLDREYEQLKTGTFEYNGNTYYADFNFIAGVFLGLATGNLPDDYTINWKTADKEPDGVTNIYTTLNKSDIIGLGLSYLNSQKKSFNIIDQKKTLLKNIYNDETKTYQDILDAEL